MFKMLVIVAIILLVGSLLLYFRFSHFSFITPQFIPNLFKKNEDVRGINTISDQPEDYLNRQIQSKSGEIIKQSKNSLQNQIQKTADNINNALENKAQQIINSISPNKDTSQIISIDSSSAEADSANEVRVIDVIKDRNFKLKLAVNKKYSLQFQNVPANFCLYIDKNQYIIESSKTVSVIFSQAGTYFIKTDFCDQNNKNIGELVVE